MDKIAKLWIRLCTFYLHLVSIPMDIVEQGLYLIYVNYQRVSSQPFLVSLPGEGRVSTALVVGVGGVLVTVGHVVRD